MRPNHHILGTWLLFVGLQIALSTEEHPPENAFMEWLSESGGGLPQIVDAGSYGNFDPQSLSRLFRRSDPSIRLLKRSDVSNIAVEDEDKVEEKRGGVSNSLLRLVRKSGLGQMVRLMKKNRYRDLRAL